MGRLFDFDGDRVVVTGASNERGIGFASARMFAEQGARLLLTGTTRQVEARAAQLRDLGCEAHAWLGDLTAEAASRELATAAGELLGGVDVLVNNAGMTSIALPSADSGESATAGEISFDAWQLGISRNLNTAFLATRALLPMLRESVRPRVVMVTSVTGPLMAMRHEAAYAAAKAGMVGLARSLALDEAGHGVCVNAVAPGWIATASQTDAEATQGKATPLGRSADPREVAAAIVFLASREASYISGQLLVVDGANSIAEERSI